MVSIPSWLFTMLHMLGTSSLLPNLFPNYYIWLLVMHTTSGQSEGRKLHT